MRRDFAKDSDREDYHPRRVYERRDAYTSRGARLTPAHIDLAGGAGGRGGAGGKAHARKTARIVVCTRSSRQGRASAHANSLPNPLISGPRNAGALNGYRIAGSRGRVVKSFVYPSPRRSSLPPSARASRGCSLFHSDVLPFTPSPLSLLLALPPAFVSCPFSPCLSPSNCPSLPPPPPLAVLDRRYRTCVRLRTRRYYLLRFTTDARVLLRAVAYRRPSIPTFAPASDCEISSGEFSGE